MSRGRALVAVLGLGLAATTGAETYSLSFSSRSNRMTWRPSFPSWNFRTPVTLSMAGDTTAQLRMNASASLNATLDQRDGRNIWTESANIRTSVLYPILGPRASVGINAGVSSTNAGLQRQRTRRQTYGFRFEYVPLAGGGGVFENLRFQVVPGVITARRFSPANPDSTIEETGLTYTGSMNTSPNFEVGGRRLNTSLSLQKTNNTLKISKSRSEALTMSAAYTLPGEVRANLSMSESRSQTGVSRSVVDSTDTAVVAELSERRNTRLSSSLSFKVFGWDMQGTQSWSRGLNTNTANADESPRNRFFARDRESDRWDIKGNVRGRVTESLLGSVRASWAASDDRRLPVTLSTGVMFRDPTDDREDRDLTVGGSLDWQLAEVHQLQLSASARMNRVDNPGASEQDRDSFNRNVALTYRGRRASGLRYDATLSSTETHRINLDATRSAENQRSRELRLSINTSYERLGTTVSHNFDISARRTIFDFDRQVNSNAIDRRSNIRRGWSMRHRLQRPLFEVLQFNLTYAFSADDFGTLLVEDASQIVEEDNSDHRVNFGMSYRPSPDLSFGVTYTYRLDRKWDVTYERAGARRRLAIRNPHRNLATSFEYKPTGYTGVSARFSRSRQRSGTFDNLSITLSRTF